MVGQLHPNKLRSCAGMVYFSPETMRIDEILIFIWIKQSNSGLDIVLKLLAVFAQIMEQAHNLALLLKIYFSCK